MKHIKLAASIIILILIVASSGCSSIQLPVFPKNAIAINAPVMPAQNSFVDANAPKPTPTANVTVTQTTRPKFVYV